MTDYKVDNKIIENEIIEKQIHLDVEKEEDYEKFEKLGRALSARIRIKILALLKHSHMNIIKLAKEINIPVSSAAFHVKVLEEAGLIVTETIPGIHGSQKLCSSKTENVVLSISSLSKKSKMHSFSMDMPIGNYYDFNISPTCGMINEENYIEACDDIRSFYSPNRTTAQLIWFRKGYIEYRFPNHFRKNPLNYLSFSLELCSEIAGYRNIWPSDITFFINHQEIFTYTSPGDFGGRHGKLTPVWWTDINTQYGLLKTISIDRKGAYLDGVLQSEQITIESLHLETFPYISFKIEVKENAKHVGGINIFGKSYGDYPQNIMMYAEY